MAFKFTTRNVYATGVAIAIALAILRYFGLSAVDAAKLARDKFVEAGQDARALTSREYANRYASKLREEAANIPIRIQGAEGKDSVEISGAIQEERRRILEERADHLERVGAWLLKGDLGSMKKQVEENARKAAGNN
jgi:hypothetical protein